MVAVQAILTTYGYSLMTKGEATTQGSLKACRPRTVRNPQQKILDNHLQAHSTPERLPDLRLRDTVELLRDD